MTVPGGNGSASGEKTASTALVRPETGQVAGPRSRHTLIVGSDVSVDEVVLLAEWSWLAAAWHAAPMRPASGVASGTLRLSRHSALEGPRPSGSAEPAEARAWVLETLRERAERLPFEVGDRDGVRRAFDGRPPHREEGRAVDWLLSAARRLCGFVVLDVARRGEPARFVELHPDPEVDTDLTLYSDVWLTPDAAERICAGALPGARLGATGFTWAGPPVPFEDQASDLRDPARRRLHGAADQADLEALAAPAALRGYAIVCPLPSPPLSGPPGPALGDPGEAPATAVRDAMGQRGYVTVEVSGRESPPRALRSVPWLAGGGVQYAVRWDPSDQDEAHREHPGAAIRGERSLAAAAGARLASALHGAVSGLVLDQSGFVVEVGDL